MVSLALRAWVVESFTVRSTSMVPTLQPGTQILVVTAGALTGSTDAGDIVVFRAPAGTTCRTVEEGSSSLVKRVIALPGDTIWSDGEDIYVNGERMNRPSWHNPPFGPVGPTPITRTTVPAGHFFVMGDNRTDTCDSRVFGPIPSSSIVGVAVATTARDGHLSAHLL